MGQLLFSAVAAHTPVTPHVPDLVWLAGYDKPTRKLLVSAERKMAGRVLVGVFLTIFINYIDRTNLAFASVQLNADIGLSPSIYGLGSGLFFIAYAFFQLPSNM
jgi:sugar phosphate permease